MSVRRWIVVVVAMLVAAPAGFAVAQTAGLDGQQPPERLVPAAECEDEVNAAWEDAGMPRSSYYPSCPTVEEAREQARWFNENRRRGLTAIAASIKRYGDGADDAAELAQIEEELESLGGPLGHPYAEAHEE